MKKAKKKQPLNGNRRGEKKLTSDSTAPSSNPLQNTDEENLSNLDEKQKLVCYGRRSLP